MCSCPLLGLYMARADSEHPAGWHKAAAASTGTLQKPGSGFPRLLGTAVFYMCSKRLKCKTLKAFVLLNVSKVHPLMLGENSVMNLYICKAFCEAFKKRFSAVLKGKDWVNVCLKNKHLKLLNFHCGWQKHTYRPFSLLYEYLNTLQKDMTKNMS